MEKKKKKTEMKREFQNSLLQEGGHLATDQSFPYSSLTLQSQKSKFILSTQSSCEELGNKIAWSVKQQRYSLSQSIFIFIILYQ